MADGWKKKALLLALNKDKNVLGSISYSCCWVPSSLKTVWYSSVQSLQQALAGSPIQNLFCVCNLDTRTCWLIVTRHCWSTFLGKVSNCQHTLFSPLRWLLMFIIFRACNNACSLFLASNANTLYSCIICSNLLVWNLQNTIPCNYHIRTLYLSGQSHRNNICMRANT